MNILSFIAVIIFSILLIEGIYVFQMNIKSSLNILFLFICLSMAIWSLGSAFAYSSANKVSVIRWEKISSIGYIFLHVFTLYFVFEYISLKKIIYKIIIFLPSIFFLIYSFNFPFVFINYEKLNGFWLCTPNLSSPVFLTFIFNYLLYYLLCIILLLFYRKKTKIKEIKKQSSIIIFSIATTIFCYNLEPFLLFIFLRNKSFAISPLFSILWISGIWYAFKKYNLMNFNINGISLKIVNSLNELVILMDKSLNIKFINEKVKNFLGIKKINFELHNTILEYNFFLEKLKTLNNKKQHLLFHSNFVNNTGINKLIKINLSIIYDKHQDLLGYLLVGEIIQNHQTFIHNFKITKREYEIIKMLMSGLSNKKIAVYLKISERTIKAHITNIYNKIGINSKFELYNIFNNYIN